MTAPRTASRRGRLLGVLVLAVVVLGAGGLWSVLVRPSGPVPVSLGPYVPASAGPDVSDGPGAVAGIEGTWTTDPPPSSGSGAREATFAGYRVRENLANIGATEAVGRTADVVGQLTIAGTTVTKAVITVNLTTLQSDSDNRDRQLVRQALETGIYPAASFTLTQPIELGPVPADGQVVQVTASGDLALHGVTRPVQLPLQARLERGSIAVAGSLAIAFADYGIVKPQALVVLSVEDHATLELLLRFRRSGG